MNISEQNKQEAEKVVEKYQTLSFYAISCAIINRQSVLDAFRNEFLKGNADLHDSSILTNLTQQITYLKSKL
jgi:hypothetical protein